jgi:hypothetical protein
VDASTAGWTGGRRGLGRSAEALVEAIVMPDERTPGRVMPIPSDDPVAALRAGVERVLAPVEQHLDEWDTRLHAALSGPRSTPMLRQRMTELRKIVARCRELGEAMVAAAETAADSQPGTDAEPLTGGGDVS